jgi:broad specificity phosphatase PhoE
MHGRVAEACAELADRAVGRNVLVVTHATPIKSAAVWALGGPASMILGLWVNLGTVTVLDSLGGEFLVREFNTPVPLAGP